MSMTSAIGVGGFWRRVGAMLRKEFVQLRRDRVTLATGSPIGLPDLMRARPSPLWPMWPSNGWSGMSAATNCAVNARSGES